MHADLNAPQRAALPQLPGWTSRWGPRTRRLLLRSLLAYAALYAAGGALALAGSGPWQHVGLGLLWPGAGFLAHVAADGPSAAWVACIVLAFAFPLSLVLWFGTGNAMAPPLVWGSAAALAGLRAGTPAPEDIAWMLCVPPTLALVCTAAWLWHGTRARKTRLRAQGIVAAASITDWRPAAASAPQPDMLSRADQQRLRFAMDRALQPLDRFDGFDWLEQNQTSAVRYQLNFLGYALAMAQARALPAWGGDLDRAQRQLVQKLADHRVWRYWALESAWGHGRLDPDPTARDNIMYTGFGALQMVLSQAAAGRLDWRAPDSLTLRHPNGRSHPAGLGTLARALARDLQAAPLGLMACEPNWVYPLCNTMSAAALQGLQSQTNEPHWDSVRADSFRRALLAEFMTPSGHFVACRSTLTGGAMPLTGGVLPAAMTAFFLNALWPDLAAQQWALLRSRLLSAGGDSLRRQAFWAIDLGNYRRSRASSWAGVALAAAELGDREVAQKCLEALDEECPEQVDGEHRHRPGVSVWTHAVELMARNASEGSLRRLVHEPAPACKGPWLEEMPRTRVSVASAHAAHGGLRACLELLDPGPHRLGVSGLQPLRRYRVWGAGAPRTLMADAQGRGELHAVMQGRQTLNLRPVP